MDQRVRFRAAHPSRPYPAIEWRQLQAQSEQAPITPFQFRYAGGSSQPSLILVETAPRWGLLPASLMYFCFGRPMHHCSGVDTRRRLLSNTMSNQYYDTHANARRKVKLIGLLLRPDAPEMSVETLTKLVTSTPQGPRKLAPILSQEPQHVRALDRYERRA